MKFVKYFEFENNDPVKTEENLINSLKINKISSKFIIADCNFAYLINTKGLDFAQKAINKYLSHKNIVFICQHILGYKLNWGHGLVFSPHASLKDSFIPISHYSINFNKDIIPFEKRKLTCSFVGSFSTHPTRSLLYQVYSNYSDFLIKDTGEWHFLVNEKKLEREEFYIESLKNSKFVFCPRGTGPGSIRFWEAIASKCIPILISNEIKVPEIIKNDIIFINQYQDILLIDNLIKLKKINKERLYRNYCNLYSNENSYKSILNFLEKTN